MIVTTLFKYTMQSLTESSCSTRSLLCTKASPRTILWHSPAPRFRSTAATVPTPRISQRLIDGTPLSYNMHALIDWILFYEDDPLIALCSMYFTFDHVYSLRHAYFFTVADCLPQHQAKFLARQADRARAKSESYWGRWRIAATETFVNQLNSHDPLHSGFGCN